MSQKRDAEHTYYPGSLTSLPMTSSYEKPNKNIYIKQVLDWVLFQLTITIIMAGYAYSKRDELNTYLNNNPGSIFLPIIFSFISLFMMYYTKSNTTKKLMFGVFTVTMSLMVSVSVLPYSPDVVLKAVITTFMLVLAINQYSKYSAKRGVKMDKLAEVGVSMLLVLIVLSILQVFIQSSMFGLIICVMGVGIFTILLIVDLNRLYDKTEDFQEDPMLAAVGIYLDIVNLFLYLLELYKRCDE